MQKTITAAVLCAIVLVGSFPAFPAEAAYPVRAGQSVAISKSSLNAPAVTLKSALVNTISAQALGVSLFELAYTIDLSAASANLSTITVGSYVDVVGTLDAANTALVHAQTVALAGTTPPPPGGGDGGDTSTTTATGVCATGGQDGQSGGWEEPFGEAVVGLVREAMGCTPTFWEFAAPGSVDRGLPPNGTSLNHKFLWYVWYYGWAMKAGTDTQKTDARTKLVNWLDGQKSVGHYSMAGGGTELLNTSHYQIWANAATAARFLAVHYKDTAMLSATGRWWRAEKALWDTLQHNGSVIAPGARFHEGQVTSPSVGSSQLRDTLYAMLTGRPLYVNPGGSGKPPGGPGVATSQWWNDYYNVSAWTMRVLLSKGDDFGGAKTATAADLPKLPYTMCLYTKGNDYVYTFPKMPKTLEPVFWVAVIGGKKTVSPYAQGQPEVATVSPPHLAGATLKVLPGVVTSNCPTDPGDTNSDPSDGGGTADVPDSSHAYTIIANILNLRKETKARAYDWQAYQRAKIPLLLGQMQEQMIALKVETDKFSGYDGVKDAMAKAQAKYTEFFVACLAPTITAPGHVSDSYKNPVKRTAGYLDDALYELRGLLPVPPAGDGSGGGGGGGGGKDLDY